MDGLRTRRPLISKRTSKTWGRTAGSYVSTQASRMTSQRIPQSRPCVPCCTAAANHSFIRAETSPASLESALKRSATQRQIRLMSTRPAKRWFSMKTNGLRLGSADLLAGLGRDRGVCSPAVCWRAFSAAGQARGLSRLHDGASDRLYRDLPLERRITLLALGAAITSFLLKN